MSELKPNNWYITNASIAQFYLLKEAFFRNIFYLRPYLFSVVFTEENFMCHIYKFRSISRFHDTCNWESVITFIIHYPIRFLCVNKKLFVQENVILQMIGLVTVFFVYLQYNVLQKHACIQYYLTCMYFSKRGNDTNLIS